MMYNVAWDEFKTFIDNGADFKYKESERAYYLFIHSDCEKISCRIQKGSADIIEFETNYKSSAVTV